MDKYEEALKRAKNHLNNDGLTLEQYETIYRIFPELEESKDEKIRKRILLSLQKDIMTTKNAGCNTKDLEECISWLEKQSEQKPTNTIVETWKDMRLEVYQQASGNRHEPNCSDDTTKMFSLNDIDEIIEKMSEPKSF